MVGILEVSEEKFSKLAMRIKTGIPLIKYEFVLISVFCYGWNRRRWTCAAPARRRRRPSDQFLILLSVELIDIWAI